MHILLLPFGSAGDVLPFIWLGRHLKARGHRVTVITGCLFENHVRRAGLQMIPLGKEDEMKAMLHDPRLWKGAHGARVYFQFAARLTEECLAAIENHDPADLIMASLAAFAGRLAREKHGTPLITVHLSPSVFFSVHETPLLHRDLRWLRMMPVWIKKVLFSLPNVADLFALPHVKRVCRNHGVKPPRSLWREWWDSPDGVLTLFPEWFAAPQPDWPANFLQWNFPLEDLASEQPLSQALQSFLAAGDPPIVITPGTGNVQAARFFDVAVRAVTKLGRRAVLATREPRQVPAGLPSTFHIEEYVPFSRLLGHAAAFVHHGGIGTVAQAFAAGVPQLVMPMAHDQFDNADRVERLGAGLVLNVNRFTVKRVARSLERLLTEPTFRGVSTRCADRLQKEGNPAPLLHWIEQRARVS